MDEQLKRRLVGAGIIVAVAVLVVPMFFEDKTQGGRDASALPEPMEEHALPLPKDDAKPDQQAGPSALPQTEQKSAPARNRKFEVVPLVEAPPKPVQAEPEPSTAPPASEPAVGLPEAPSDAEAMDEEPQPSSNRAPKAARSGGGAAKAKPAGTAPAKKTTTPSATGSQTAAGAKSKTGTAESKKRNTAGSRTPSTASKPKTSSSTTKTATPPPSKSAPAAKTATPDRKGSGTTTPAKSPTPAKPKAAMPRSDSGTGAGDHWAVQAGTFVEESNARNLAEKLRQRNLPVRVQTAEGASGKVYRVTVGPNLDRTKAEKIQKQLAAQDDVQGMILQTR